MGAPNFLDLMTLQTSWGPLCILWVLVLSDLVAPLLMLNNGPRSFQTWLSSTLASMPAAFPMAAGALGHWPTDTLYDSLLWRKNMSSRSIIHDWDMFIACWARWRMVNPDKLSWLLSSNFYSNSVLFPMYLLPGARQGQTQLTANDASFYISILCIYYVYIYIHIYIHNNIVPSPNHHIP